MSVCRNAVFSVMHLFALTSQYRELRRDRHLVYHIAQELRNSLPSEVIDEIAVPSYLHRNPLMRYLFWERLAVALEWVDAQRPAPRTVLDFGSGIGIMLPPLRRRGIGLIACDIHPEVTLAGVCAFGLTGVQVLDARQGLCVLPDSSVDVVLALDVLEHVQDVVSLAAQFERILSAGGRLLCSLPTENALYRLGRRLAGFSGAYHVHDPGRVRRQLASHLAVRPLGCLYFFLPLFEFYEGAKA